MQFKKMFCNLIYISEYIGEQRDGKSCCGEGLAS